MQSNSRTRKTGIRRGLAVLLAALLISVFAHPAAAGQAWCRSDPVVILSDGTTLDISAGIGAQLWDVQTVDYTLHIPSNRSVVAVVKTPSWPTTIERLTISRDNPPGVYTVETVVQTDESGVDVTAETALVSVLHVVLAHGATDGQSGETLVTNFSY